MTKEKPLICAIDLEEDIVQAIEAKDLHCFSGTLGNRIKVPNSNYNKETPLPLHHHKLPLNLHEYDVIIIDLKCREPIEYCKSDFEDYLNYCSGNEKSFFLSSFPQTVFDPRPFSSNYIKLKLTECFGKEILIIIFCSSDVNVDYKIKKISSYDDNNSIYKPCIDTKNYFLYEFLPFFRRYSNNHYSLGKYKMGEKVNCDKRGCSLIDILAKNTNNFIYEFIFYHPKVWDQNTKQEVERYNFIPLLFNEQKEIIGFLDLADNIKTLALPYIIDQEKKKDLIIELLDVGLPELFSKIFPYSTQFAWLKSEPYYLPKYAKLLDKKQKIEEEYKLKLKQVETEIKDNENQYKFLHDLITETGDKLVKSVEYFLQWLGFENVINMDENNPDIKEEDLQINLEDGLLIIEVKGITGTSKDKECSQIYKIKNRRNEERKKFDVLALYIVNHQRFLPPEERNNPPFSDDQIKDANLDKRGLLTTYELFKLYFKIAQDFIMKEDARKCLLNYGLVEFIPSNANNLGCPSEIHHNGKVAILNIQNIPINKGSSIIICNGNDWFETKVLGIQLDGKSFDSISNGEIGIELDKPISKKSILWLKNLKKRIFKNFEKI